MHRKHCGVAWPAGLLALIDRNFQGFGKEIFTGEAQRLCTALNPLQHAQVLLLWHCTNCWPPAECGTLEQAGHGKITSLLVQRTLPSLKQRSGLRQA